MIQDSQHSFTKDKFCLTNLVALHDGVSAMVNNKRLTDVMYLGFHDIIPYDSLSPDWRGMAMRDVLYSEQGICWKDTARELLSMALVEPPGQGW